MHCGGQDPGETTPCVGSLVSPNVATQLLLLTLSYEKHPFCL